MAHLITGYAGQAHIKSEDQGSFNASVFGGGQFVMTAGNQVEASIINNNTVRVLDGDLLMYGRHIRIEPNTYEDMTITTGATNYNRIDLIVMTYEKDSNTGIERAYLEVIQGSQSAGTPTAPSYIQGDILAGATKNQMPLYKVSIEGVVLKGITKLFTIRQPYSGQNYDDRYYTKSQIDISLAGKSDSTHTHDDRYYTESEVDEMIVKPNLLDNGWFTVNQRGGKIVPSGVNYYQGASTTAVGTTTQAYKVEYIDSYSNAIFKIGDTTYWTYATNVVDGYADGGYTVDRWRAATTSSSGQTSTVTITDGVVNFKVTNSTGYYRFRQDISERKFKSGETYTVSARVKVNSRSGSYITLRLCDGGTAVTGGSSSDISTIGQWVTVVRTVTLSADIAYPAVEILVNSGINADIDIACIKLEVGSVSTLANDVAPDYATELAKCQRYYVKKTFAADEFIGLVGGGYAKVYIDTGCKPMRTVPSVSVNGTIYLWSQNNYGFPEMTYSAVNSIDKLVIVGTISSGIPYTVSYALSYSTPVTIELSADL